ncbi:MAG TPA: M48 family metalloprotease [Vicinamibacterales bacterium]|nr:M48 family metalloprotease [Vicinamibacterales bacterium]
MNETKSARYHRLKRRAGFAAFACTAILLAAMLWARPSLPVAGYVLLLAVLHGLVTLPAAFYGSFVLEHRYELSSEPATAWLRDHAKAFGLGSVLAVVAAQIIYGLMAWSPAWWWLAAAIAGTAVTIVLAKLTPVVLLPLFYKFTPLDRPALAARLTELSARAGVPALGVFEWGLGAKTRRANAALVGSGRTRRILLSDTLLDQYSEDEIEVILAHELAHHAHRDIPKGIALEFGLLLAALFAASTALEALWRPLGLHGPADPAGLPLLLLAAGAVTMAATPMVNAFSRFNERRADDFAIALTRRREAFVSAMRRLAAQNLVEESPSRTIVWLFHTHPPIEERIEQARSVGP